MRAQLILRSIVRKKGDLILTFFFSPSDVLVRIEAVTKGHHSTLSLGLFDPLELIRCDELDGKMTVKRKREVIGSPPALHRVSMTGSLLWEQQPPAGGLFL